MFVCYRSIRTDYVPVVIEVDDVRLGRPRSRRTLYGFALCPEPTLHADLLRVSAVIQLPTIHTRKSILPFGGLRKQAQPELQLPFPNDCHAHADTAGGAVTAITLRTYSEWKEEGFKVSLYSVYEYICDCTTLL